MATYKKRGYKVNTKPEKSEVEDQDQDAIDNSTTAEVFDTLDETANKAEEWVVANQKPIYSIIAALVVVILGFVGYNKFVAEPNANEAMNEMFTSKKFFNEAINATDKDSLLNLAINGGNNKLGFLDIIENYSGTPAANLANYYVGASYFHKKDYKKAIEYLGDFSSDDLILSPLAIGLIGDSFAQLDQLDEALEYYTKAASKTSNSFTTPMYLNKAGLVALNNKDYKSALEIFEKIKKNYPKSTEASNVEVLIGNAKANL